MPPSPDEPVTGQRLLARLYIKPQTFKIEADNALRSGDATWGRIIRPDGHAVADFDVSTKKGGGYVRFNTTNFMKADQQQPRLDEDDEA